MPQPTASILDQVWEKRSSEAASPTHPQPSGSDRQLGQDASAPVGEASQPADGEAPSGDRLGRQRRGQIRPDAAADGRAEARRGDGHGITDYTGTSPLQLAARQCFLVEPNSLTTSDRLINPGILRILVMRVGSPVRGEHLVRTLLEQLLARGNARTVGAALQSGVDFALEHCRSILFPLAINKNPEAIGAIDELTVDVNGRDDETGATALYHAAQRGRPEQVEFLLDRGADPNLPLSNGETILQAALKTVYFDCDDERQMEMARVVELLLQRGALVSRPIWKYELCTVESRLSTRIMMSHLAMLYLLGDEARLVTREDIEAVASGYHEQFFRSCVRELEALRAVEVSGEVTLFRLLVEGDERVLVYYRDPEFFEAFERVMDKLPDLETYYFATLYRRTEWAIETIELRREVETVIEGLTGLCSDVYRAIVLRIIGYLKLSDLRNLKKVC